MIQHDEELLRRVAQLLSGSEIDVALQDEFDRGETRYQLEQELASEAATVDEMLALLAVTDDPDELALLLDDLQAWLLSPFTPRHMKQRIKRAIRDRLRSE